MSDELDAITRQAFLLLEEKRGGDTLLATRAEHINDLESEIVDLIHETSQLQGDLEIRQKEAVQLRIVISDKNEDLATANKEKASLRERIEMESNKAKKALDSLNLNISMGEATIASYEQKFEDLRSDSASLQKRLDVCQSDVEKLNASLSVLLTSLK
eukprot:CAMPEP_0204628582 /NCGR_PEP_ID=MMETSP0717-20131115/16172_1 /ASSEMBLY_ACC=CAM_ASM_000666 /TAXON_ID=230516 /ORGANISM="Chaetoceros curvisetus" /LENGTH=157 /DNA_ID=CAMNT_0051645241 /DNA_START=8 /DNA_END=481 /DNA_ORIENTATION=-